MHWGCYYAAALDIEVDPQRRRFGCLGENVVFVFSTAVPITKLFACVWGGNNGGHVLRETTSRGLCELACPSRTSERGGEGYCVKEGGGKEGERERERARKVRLHSNITICYKYSAKGIPFIFADVAGSSIAIVNPLAKLPGHAK